MNKATREAMEAQEKAKKKLGMAIGAAASIAGESLGGGESAVSSATPDYVANVASKTPFTNASFDAGNIKFMPSGGAGATAGGVLSGIGKGFLHGAGVGGLGGLGRGTGKTADDLNNAIALHSAEKDIDIAGQKDLADYHDKIAIVKEERDWNNFKREKGELLRHDALMKSQASGIPADPSNPAWNDWFESEYMPLARAEWKTGREQAIAQNTLGTHTAQNTDVISQATHPFNLGTALNRAKAAQILSGGELETAPAVNANAADLQTLIPIQRRSALAHSLIGPAFNPGSNHPIYNPSTGDFNLLGIPSEAETNAAKYGGEPTKGITSTPLNILGGQPQYERASDGQMVPLRNKTPLLPPLSIGKMGSGLNSNPNPNLIRDEAPAEGFGEPTSQFLIPSGSQVAPPPAESTLQPPLTSPQLQPFGTRVKQGTKEMLEEFFGPKWYEKVPFGQYYSPEYNR